MAYGLKYTSSFYSEAWSGTTSTQYILKIYKEGFSGSSEEVCMGGNPCTEKAINSDDLPYGVKGCRYEFEIVSDTLSVNDFYTEDGKDFLFELYEAGTPDILIRKGYLISEDVSEEYSDGTKTITITGTDGLELLKTINYELVDDKDYKGIASVFSILFNCLNKIGLGIKFNTAFNYYPNGVTAGDGIDSLAFHSLHQELFKGLTCFEVLERLTQTHQCVLEQEDGEWWYIHKINPTGATVTYRKWDSAGTIIGSYTFPSPITVAFEGEYAPVEKPQVLKNRPYKRIISEVDLQGYENKLRNPEFQDGFDEWNQDELAPVDSYSFGGLGTTKDPYYIQINGYDPNTKNIAGEPNTASNRIYQEVTTIYNSAVDTEGVSTYLNKGITISGKCIGNGVKSAACQVILRMTFAGYSPSVDFTLSETGEWIDSGELSNKDPEFINVPLIFSDGLNKDEYTSFKVESKNIGSAVITKTFYHRIFANKLWKLKIEDMTSCKVLFTLQEGVEQTTVTSSPEWVRWADLKMEVIDRTRSVGLKKNRYVSQKTGVAPNELKIERYFADFYEKEQFISILGSGETPTSLWTTTNNNNTGDLMTALTRELFSLYYKPISIYDGNILGRVKKYHTINLVDYAEPLFNINWGYDFGRNIADGSRYIMTFPEYIGDDNKKYGVYNDDKEILYDGEYPTGQLDFDEAPILNGDLIAKNLTRIKENVVFDDYMTFSKTSNESGINWYDSVTGDKTDYFVTSEEGFKFKSASSDYDVILDFTGITSDTTLRVPILGEASTIATDTTAWMLDGNALTATKSIGSKTNYDVSVIRNSVTKANFGATTTDFDAEVYNFKNGGTTYATLNSTGSHFSGTINANSVGSNIRLRSNGTDALDAFIGNDANGNIYLSNWNVNRGWRISANGDINSLGSGNVGIGTTSPSEKLELANGRMRISGGGSNIKSLVLQGGDDSSNYSRIVAYDYTAGSYINLALQDGGGNVGIGTILPANKLHVLSSSSTLAMLETSVSEAYFGLKSNTGGIVYFGNKNGGDFTIQTAGSGYSDKFYVTSNGNVGIGTTSPTQKLDVNGTSRTTNLMITNGATVGYVWQCTNSDGSGAWTTTLASERYKGEYDASSGSAPSATPIAGDYYRVNNGGTYLGITYVAGDDIYYNGTTWAKRSNYLTLPIATSSILGGIKIGSNLSIDGSGVVTVASSPILTTARTIALSGDATWSVSFNGSADVTSALTLATVNSNVGTFRSVTVNAKGLVTAATNPAIALGSEVSGILPIANGGTGSATQNFVDLTTTQTVGGIKTFSSQVTAQSFYTSSVMKSGNFSSSSVTYNTLGSSFLLSGTSLYFGYLPMIFRASQYVLDRGFVKIGGNTSGLPADVAFATERLDVTGNIRYSGTLKPSNTAGTSGQALLTDGINDTWTTLTVSHISDIASTYQPLDDDLTAIAALSGTSGLLKKTASNTWALDTSTYLTSVSLTTNVTGILPIANGGTGSNTKNFVDLTTEQSNIAGIKTFTSHILVRGLRIGESDGFAGTGFGGDVYVDTNALGSLSRPIDLQTDKVYFSDASSLPYAVITSSGLKLGGLEHYGSIPSERLDIEGNITYTGVLMPEGSAGTSGQFLKTTSTANVWSTILTSDVYNLEPILSDKQDSLIGTGLVRSVGGSISYIDGNNGQVLIKDGSGIPNFMNLELKPMYLTHKRLAVGTEFDNYGEVRNLTFEAGRVLRVSNISNQANSMNLGITANDVDGILEYNGIGDMWLKSQRDIYIDNFKGGGDRFLKVTNDGKVYTTASGGGSSSQDLDSVLSYGNTANNRTMVFKNDTTNIFTVRTASDTLKSTFGTGAEHVTWATSGNVDIELNSSRDLRMFVASGRTIMLGESAPNKPINLYGENYLFNKENLFQGANKWGSADNQSTPQNGDIISFIMLSGHWRPIKTKTVTTTVGGVTGDFMYITN